MGTIALQFVLAHAGGDGDAGDHDPHLAGESDSLAHAQGASPGHLVPTGLTDAAGLFLSLRFWTYLLLAFGMVGAPLNYLKLTNDVTGFVIASVSGLSAGLAASLAFRALKPGISSSTTSADTIGHMATVTVPVCKGTHGKIRLELKGKRIDLLATTDADELPRGAEVVVVEFRGESAHVESIGTKRET